MPRNSMAGFRSFTTARLLGCIEIQSFAPHWRFLVKIKNKFSGVVSSERADIARAMIRQGMAEALEPDTGESPSGLPKPGDYRPPQRNWSIDLIAAFDLQDPVKKWLAIRCDFHNSVTFCTAAPDAVHNRKTWDGKPFCSSFGVCVPPEMLDQYRKQWKASPHLRAPLPERPSCPENESMKAKKEMLDREVSSGDLSVSDPNSWS